jgi:hypothetical protein
MWGMSAPITSSLPNGWQRKRAGPESNGSFIFQELAQMPHHNRGTFESEGELAVRAVFPDAIFIRPAVMFGPDDAFLTTDSSSSAGAQSIRCSALA